jgi:hypothetical protein
MAQNKNAMKRYSISLTGKNLENIATLQSELGFASLSETVRACINSMYTKTFPNYARPVNVPSPRATGMSLSPEAVEEQKKEKAKAEAERKKNLKQQRDSDKLAYCIQICEQDLNGAVGDDDDGNPVMCSYFQYEGRRRYEQEIDIMSVTPELVQSQYLPNRDHVEKLQRDGHVDYDVNQLITDVLVAEE